MATGLGRVGLRACSIGADLKRTVVKELSLVATDKTTPLPAFGYTLISPARSMETAHTT